MHVRPVFLSAMERKINISVNETIRASKDKKMFEAYTFAYLVTATFISSRINHPTQRRICELFRLSPKRYIRIKNNAINIWLHKI